MTNLKQAEFDIVLYHAGCDDGFGGAWAARKALGDHIQCIPVQYGSPPPELPKGSHVVLVDFSYDRTTVQAMKDNAGRFLILDHHKTAEAELEGLEYAIFDMDRSGAMMAWDYFHEDQPPALIKYIQDRDLWRKELDGSDLYTAALRSYRQDFNVWNNLAGTDVEELLNEGGAIYRAVGVQVERQTLNAQLVNIGGHEVPVANATCYISEVCDELLNQNPTAEFSAVYFVRADGKQVYSLRSRSDFDVSEVAKSLGGGGHKNAAGYTTD